jgi:hypothetical protein
MISNAFPLVFLVFALLYMTMLCCYSCPTQWFEFVIIREPIRAARQATECDGKPDEGFTQECFPSRRTSLNGQPIPALTPTAAGVRVELPRERLYLLYSPCIQLEPC